MKGWKIEFRLKAAGPRCLLDVGQTGKKFQPPGFKQNVSGRGTFLEGRLSACVSLRTGKVPSALLFDMMRSSVIGSFLQVTCAAR